MLPRVILYTRKPSRMVIDDGVRYIESCEIVGRDVAVEAIFYNMVYIHTKRSATPERFNIITIKNGRKKIRSSRRVIVVAVDV